MVPPTTTPTPSASASDIDYLQTCAAAGVGGAFGLGFAWVAGESLIAAMLVGAVTMLALGIPFGVAAIALGVFARFICRSAGATAAWRRTPTQRGRAGPAGREHGDGRAHRAGSFKKS